MKKAFKDMTPYEQMEEVIGKRPITIKWNDGHTSEAVLGYFFNDEEGCKEMLERKKAGKPYAVSIETHLMKGEEGKDGKYKAQIKDIGEFYTEYLQVYYERDGNLKNDRTGRK